MSVRTYLMDGPQSDTIITAGYDQAFSKYSK